MKLLCEKFPFRRKDVEFQQRLVVWKTRGEVWRYGWNIYGKGRGAGSGRAIGRWLVLLRGNHTVCGKGCVGGSGNEFDVAGVQEL